MRGDADYGAGVDKSDDELGPLATDFEAFVGECESIVAEAAARGPDESDPSPDL